jgi:hypothetical protein
MIVRSEPHLYRDPHLYTLHMNEYDLCSGPENPRVKEANALLTQDKVPIEAILEKVHATRRLQRTGGSGSSLNG